jgi:hypothetical protein
VVEGAGASLHLACFTLSGWLRTLLVQVNEHAGAFSAATAVPSMISLVNEAV